MNKMLLNPFLLRIARQDIPIHDHVVGCPWEYCAPYCADSVGSECKLRLRLFLVQICLPGTSRSLSVWRACSSYEMVHPKEYCIAAKNITRLNFLIAQSKSKFRVTLWPVLQHLQRDIRTQIWKTFHRLRLRGESHSAIPLTPRYAAAFACHWISYDSYWM